jgi:hypothetical protein
MRWHEYPLGAQVAAQQAYILAKRVPILRYERGRPRKAANEAVCHRSVAAASSAAAIFSQC